MPREDPSHGEEKPVHDMVEIFKRRRTVRRTQYGGDYAKSDNRVSRQNTGRTVQRTHRTTVTERREEMKERPHANAGRSGIYTPDGPALHGGRQGQRAIQDNGRSDATRWTVWHATPDGPSFTMNV